jgi:hypothetical protein
MCFMYETLFHKRVYRAMLFSGLKSNLKGVDTWTEDHNELG